MLTIKASIAAVVLAATATVSAGAGYVVTRVTSGRSRAELPTRHRCTCGTVSRLPLGGPPMPTNEGKTW